MLTMIYGNHESYALHPTTLYESCFSQKHIYKKFGIRLLELIVNN